MSMNHQEAIAAPLAELSAPLATSTIVWELEDLGFLAAAITWIREDMAGSYVDIARLWFPGRSRARAADAVRAIYHLILCVETARIQRAAGKIADAEQSERLMEHFYQQLPAFARW